MKELFEKVSFTTAAIIYMYLCGGFYLLAFWNVFEIDVTNFVTITEIPRSFIYPIYRLISVYVFLTIYFIHMRPRNFTPTTSEPAPEKKVKTSRSAYILTGEALLGFTLISAWILYDDYKDRPLYWLLVTTFMAISAIIIVTKRNFILSNSLSLASNKLIIGVLILIPMISVLLGKTDALGIKNNFRVKYVTLLKSDSFSDTIPSNKKIKLIGFIGSKVVLSTVNNQKIFVLDQGEAKNIQLQDSKFTESK